MSDPDARPWPRNRMDQHVRQRIREYAERVLAITQDDDDALVASLTFGGENLIWWAVQNAVEEAGWLVMPEPSS